MLRLIKPLRVVSGFPKISLIIKALTDSLKSIGNLVLLLILFCLVYAGMGLNVFIGQLDSRCRVTSEPPSSGVWEVAQGATFICGNKACPIGSYCRNLVDYEQK